MVVKRLFNRLQKRGSASSRFTPQAGTEKSPVHQGWEKKNGRKKYQTDLAG
jgi:hypothetical protein